MAAINSVCVYCASSLGPESHRRAARELAEQLATRSIHLVFGGGSVGLMGVVADRVKELGGRATGVIPNGLARKEVSHQGVDELIVVDSMHARKSEMANRADAFVTLPGGLGTLEELMETATWVLLGIHSKPCGILNVEGYFDPLLAFLDQVVEDGYLKPSHRELLVVDDEPAALLDRMSEWSAPVQTRWMHQEDLSI